MDFEYNDDEIQFINKKQDRLTKLSMWFLAAPHVTIFFAYVWAILSEDPFELPFPTWYPIDWRNNKLHYWIAYIYQCIGGVILINVNVASDLLLFNFLSVGSNQLETIGRRLEAIAVVSPTKSSKHLHLASHSEQKQIFVDLINSVKIHQRLNW